MTNTGSKWQHVHAAARRLLDAPEFRDDIKPVDLTSVLYSPEAERFAAHWNSLTPHQRALFTLCTASFGVRIVKAILERKAAETAAGRTGQAERRTGAAPADAVESRDPDGNHGDNLRSAQK